MVSSATNTVTASETVSSTVKNPDVEMNMLFIVNETAAIIIDIEMPPPMRIRGRLNGLNAATTGFFPRKLTKNSPLPENEKLHLILSCLVPNNKVKKKSVKFTLIISLRLLYQNWLQVKA